ncbi:MAG TPA: dipeptidase [Terriglobales bacterium]|nr:dipeptidase [Terriglobales bacterium]
MRAHVRLFVWLLVTSPVLAQTAAKPAAKPDPRAVHNSALIIDTHADTTQYFNDDFDITKGALAEGRHLDLELARRGNLGAQFFSIWVDPEAPRSQGRFALRTFEQIDSVYRQVARHPDRMMMAFSPADIQRAHAGRKLAVLMGIEGGHSIENNLALLRDYYRLGVRYMTITWSNSTDWADSSGDIDKAGVPHTKKGLTEFGEEVIREMNRLGMMVDISHVSDRTFYRTLVISRAPVIASHSSARALTNHRRNMTDDMLRAVARNNGVVMVNFYSGFVDEDYRREAAQLNAEANAAEEKLRAQLKDADAVTYYRAFNKLHREFAARVPRPPLKSLIDHIDHVAKIAGIDHVGLGSDFDGITSLPQGIDSVADLPKITEALAARGYTAEQLHKILGGNLMRVFRDVERVSHDMQAEEKADAAAAATKR